MFIRKPACEGLDGVRGLQRLSGIGGRVRLGVLALGLFAGFHRLRQTIGEADGLGAGQRGIRDVEVPQGIGDAAGVGGEFGSLGGGDGLGGLASEVAHLGRQFGGEVVGRVLVLKRGLEPVERGLGVGDGRRQGATKLLHASQTVRDFGRRGLDDRDRELPLVRAVAAPDDQPVRALSEGHIHRVLIGRIASHRLRVIYLLAVKPDGQGVVGADHQAAGSGGGAVELGHAEGRDARAGLREQGIQVDQAPVATGGTLPGDGVVVLVGLRGFQVDGPVERERGIGVEREGAKQVPIVGAFGGAVGGRFGGGGFAEGVDGVGEGLAR